MATAVRMAERPSGVSIGQVFAAAFAAIRSNPAVFFGTSLLLGAVPSLLLNRFEAAVGLGAPASFFLSKGGLTLGASVFLLAVFLNMLVQGALVRASVEHARGAKASFGDALAVGLRAALPLFALSVLLVLGCYAGLLLLLVPGVMLWCMWAVAGPALVNERLGIVAAFGRSRFLTKGARWKVFLLELLVVLITSTISGVLWTILRLFVGTSSMLQALQQTQQHGMPFGFILAQILVGTVVTTVWTAVQNALYVELSAWKDSASPDHLADVFA